MKQMYTKTAALIAVLLAPDVACTATDEHVNVLELQTLCQLVILADTGITNEFQKPLTEEVSDELERLNLSVAENAWRGKLKTLGTPTAPQHDPCLQTPKPETCSPQYKRWEALNIAMHAKENTQKYKKFSDTKLFSPTGRAATIAISAAVEQALELKDNYNRELAESPPELAMTAAEYVKKAVYGSKAPTGSPTPECTPALGGTKATDCKLPKAGEEICISMLSLCAQDGTQNKPVCGTSASPDPSGWTWADTNKQAIWGHIHSVCKAKAPPKLDAATLAAAVTSVQTIIKHHSHASGESLVIGTPGNNPNCAKESGKACVNLAGMQVKTATAPTEDLTWLRTLEAAKKRLERDAELTRERTRVAARIKALQKKAAMIVAHLDRTDDKTAVSAAQAQQVADKSKAPEEQCNKMKGETECNTDPKCSYNST
uniref:Variant surface glycoprotein 1125.1279 n=1 Tax=Trypanosoma brucei TaxID=5691 RepID=A0A1J0R6R3_9TRYP|nr:variant surface glycoprotein 1125.1279 [Trypanosoma brucei]